MKKRFLFKNQGPDDEVLVEALCYAVKVSSQSNDKNIHLVFPQKSNFESTNLGKIIDQIFGVGSAKKLCKGESIRNLDFILPSKISSNNSSGTILAIYCTPNDMNKIEMILAKQYLAQIENTILSKNTEEEILTHLLDGDYQNPDLFKLQIANTWLEQMNQVHLALIDVSNRTNLQMSYRSLDTKLETALAGTRPFLYQKNILLFIHEKRQVEILETIAKEFQVCIVISGVIKDIYELPKIYKQILEVSSLLQNKAFSAKVFYTEGYRLRMMLDQIKSRFDLVPDVYKKMYEYDKENHTVYCKTLYYYELKNHSVIETAQELFTHRNTIVYRLRKIKEMFHIDEAHESEKLIRLISLSLCLIKMDQDDIVLDYMHAIDIFKK